MQPEELRMLNEAVARNCAIVVSLPSAGMVRSSKSRFLGDCDQGVWTEIDTQHHVLVAELAGSGKPCGIVFRSGDKKVSFTSPILRFDPAYPMNSGINVPAILVARPTALNALQRRGSYRVRVPLDSGLKVRLWRLAEHADLRDRPMRAAEMELQVHDLSMGGLGVTLLPRDGQPPRVETEERVRVEMLFGEIHVLTEARVRQLRPMPTGKTIQAGLRFDFKETDLKDRQQMTALAKIVAELQRDEVRRHHLGAA